MNEYIIHKQFCNHLTSCHFKLVCLFLSQNTEGDFSVIFLKLEMTFFVNFGIFWNCIVWKLQYLFIVIACLLSLLCSLEERTYVFGTTRGWINNHRFVIYFWVKYSFKWWQWYHVMFGTWAHCIRKQWLCVSEGGWFDYYYGLWYCENKIIIFLLTNNIHKRAPSHCKHLQQIINNLN